MENKEILDNLIEFENETMEKYPGESQGEFKNRCYSGTLKSIEKRHYCYRQLYNLAKNKKVPKDYILNILEEAVKCLHFGIKLAERAEPYDDFFIEKMKYFEEEGKIFSKIGLQIAKMCYGNDSVIVAIWRARGSKYFELY